MLLLLWIRTYFLNDFIWSYSKIYRSLSSALAFYIYTYLNEHRKWMSTISSALHRHCKGAAVIHCCKNTQELQKKCFPVASLSMRSLLIYFMPSCAKLKLDAAATRLRTHIQFLFYTYLHMHIASHTLISCYIPTGGVNKFFRNAPKWAEQ